MQDQVLMPLSSELGSVIVIYLLIFIPLSFYLWKPDVIAISNCIDMSNRFTHNNFLRIYPYGLRFDSSNYNPIIAWAHGAQMVAANMQVRLDFFSNIL